MRPRSWMPHLVLLAIAGAMALVAGVKHLSTEEALRVAGLSTFYDEKGAIGRRYRRQDEIGTPFCVTVDGDTLSDDVVTVRHRDSMQQEKVKVSELLTYLIESMSGWSRQ